MGGVCFGVWGVNFLALGGVGGGPLVVSLVVFGGLIGRPVCDQCKFLLCNLYRISFLSLIAGSLTAILPHLIAFGDVLCSNLMMLA